MTLLLVAQGSFREQHYLLYLFPFGSVITAQLAILMIPRYIYFGSQMSQINPLKIRLVLKTVISNL